jgi:hypothetical protein
MNNLRIETHPQSIVWRTSSHPRTPHGRVSQRRCCNRRTPLRPPNWQWYDYSSRIFLWRQDKFSVSWIMWSICLSLIVSILIFFFSCRVRTFAYSPTRFQVFHSWRSTFRLQHVANKLGNALRTFRLKEMLKVLIFDVCEIPFVEGIGQIVV